MIEVTGLIWDEWNKEHIARHGVSIEEVADVGHSKYHSIDSYRKRLLVIGKTKAGKRLAIVLSHEDRNLKAYNRGIYYVITAFEKEVKK